MPQRTPHSLENTDKQHILSSISALGSVAASVALVVDRPVTEAIRLLELSRDVLAGSLKVLRSDTSSLEQKHPKLAEEFVSLRNSVMTTSDQIITTEHQSTALREELEDEPVMDRHEVAQNLKVP